MKIRSLQKTLQTFNLPARSLHLPGHGEAEVTEAELKSKELAKAVNVLHTVKVLKDKKLATEVTPVATPGSAPVKK